MDVKNIKNIDKITYRGEYDPKTSPHKNHQMKSEKMLPTIREAIIRSGLKDGMTISFHHHFRNGDYVVNMVLDEIAKLGIKDLTVAASSLTSCHAPMIEHIKNGVVTHIETSGLRGELAEAVSRGLMDTPVVFRSHGGRADAIANGDIHIDVAFLGAPTCDVMGNANGYNRYEENATMCGSMGYAMVDAEFADCTVVITDHIVPYPNTPCGIPAVNVRYIVEVEHVGDPAGIMSGATRYTKNPKELMIAKAAAEVIEHSGYFKDGFSMQMGSGGASLATARFLREKMLEKGIHCDFALGGITGQIAEMHEEGLIDKILDVQSFDLRAAESLKNNRFHAQIDGCFYAGYDYIGAAVNALDFVILSALEIDTDFNVNVLTGSDGVIRGAIVVHPDTADGAKMSVVVGPLTRGRIPTIVDHVQTVITPGADVDVVVTDQGVAVNPRRPELARKLQEAGVNLYSIEELKERAEKIVGKPDPIKYKDKVVGLALYRDNSIIDLIYEIDESDMSR